MTLAAKKPVHQFISHCLSHRCVFWFHEPTRRVSRSSSKSKMPWRMLKERFPESQKVPTQGWFWAWHFFGASGVSHGSQRWLQSKGRMLSIPRETENEVPEGHIWRQLWNSDKYFKRYSEVKMVHIHRWAPVLCPRDSIYCIKFQTWPRGQLGLFNRNCSTAAAKPIPIQEALLHHLVWSSQWL